MNPTTTLDLSSFQPPAVIKPRDLKVASTLARGCPGLGHVYAGNIRRGLVFMAAVDLPIALGALFLIAPWGSIPAALVFWVIALALSIWSVIDARKVVRATRSDYRMKDYNHWLAYAVIGVVPTLAVALATSIAIINTLSQPIVSAADLPQIGIARGDRMVEWKAAYRDHKPAIGDRIVFRQTLDDPTIFLGRITALPGDALTTTTGEVAVPAGSLGVERDSSPEGRFLIPEMAVRENSSTASGRSAAPDRSTMSRRLPDERLILPQPKHPESGNKPPSPVLSIRLRRAEPARLRSGTLRSGAIQPNQRHHEKADYTRSRPLPLRQRLRR